MTGSAFTETAKHDWEKNSSVVCYVITRSTKVLANFADEICDRKGR